MKQIYEVTVEDGARRWRQNGKYHRTDGPAFEYADGTKAWYKNGKLHRTDGPAIEYKDGSKSWHKNGKLHRTDGPAVEETSGDKAWYLNGTKLNKKEFLAKTKPSCDGKVVVIDGVKYKLTVA